MWTKAYLVPGNRVWHEAGLQDTMLGLLTTQDLFRKNNWNVWHLPWGKRKQVAPESWYLSTEYRMSTEQDRWSDKISVEVAWLKMSVGTTAVLTEVFCALPQSLQVNTGLEPKFRLRSVSSVHWQNTLFVTTGLHITPVPGRPGYQLSFGGTWYFQRNYCSLFFYIQKCVSVHMHRTESAR